MDRRVTTAGERLQQDLEDAELDLGEADRVAACSDRPCGRVVDEIADRQDRLVGLSGSALQRSQPGQELGEVERLHHVVVDAFVEPEDAVGRDVSSREHQDRQPRTRATQRLHDLDPAHDGHPPVEDGDVVLVGRKVRERVRAVSDAVDDVPGPLQPPLQHRPEGVVVLGHENPHRPLFYLIKPASSFRG